MTAERPDLEAVLALDLKCLSAADGGPLDAVAHRRALEQSLGRAHWALVHRQERLVAYGYCWGEGPDWFVGGLCIDPDHRNVRVTTELARRFLTLVEQLGVAQLRSHVRRANAQSMRLHRRLGFAVEQESDIAVAFVITAPALRSAMARFTPG